MKKSISYPIDFVTIDDLNNDPDIINDLGSVNYSFGISKYLITNQQFIEFLNDTQNNFFNLSDSYDERCGIGWDKKQFYVKKDFDERPISFINLNIGKAFCNYIYNLENGLDFNVESCYNFISNDRLLAKGYFLPNLNEWHKTAFYNGKDYNDYPIKDNFSPIYSHLEDGRMMNVNVDTVNFNNTYDYNNFNGFISNVGEVGSCSQYGVYDMAGNLYDLVLDKEPYLAGGSWHSWRTSLNKRKYLKFNNARHFGATIGLRLVKL